MTSYHLYIIDENGRSASWNHSRTDRRPCLHFPDDKDSVVVLEHPSRTTHLYISKDGMLDIEVIEEE